MSVHLLHYSPQQADHPAETQYWQSSHELSQITSPDESQLKSDVGHDQRQVSVQPQRMRSEHQTLSERYPSSATVKHHLGYLAMLFNVSLWCHLCSAELITRPTDVLVIHNIMLYH